MFKINDKDIKELEADLKTFGARAFPFATKQTLNSAAFEAQKLSRLNVKVKMIQRNKFTIQSIQVDQTRTLNVRRQEATVGSTVGYMEDQEFGTTKMKNGSEGVSIATSYSAGQGMNSQPRIRLPRKPNRMQNIQLSKRRGKGKNRKQRNKIAIQTAATTGRKHIFLDLGKRKGIFKVVGSKRKPKIRMVHDMTSQSVVIPRNPWLKPAVDRVQVLMPDMYRKALTFQLKRLSLFS